MASIDRQYGKAKRERSRTNEEIGEWHHNSAALLLRIEHAGKPCNVRRQRIDRDGGRKFLDERFAASPAFGGISTVNSVDEFDDANSR